MKPVATTYAPISHQELTILANFIGRKHWPWVETNPIMQLLDTVAKRPMPPVQIITGGLSNGQQAQQQENKQASPEGVVEALRVGGEAPSEAQ